MSAPDPRWAYDPASRCVAQGADHQAGMWLHCDRVKHPMDQPHAMFVPASVRPIRWLDGRIIPEPEEDQ